MPILQEDNYIRPAYLFNRDLETVIPSMFRKIKGVNYQRERLHTSDGDFIDLDWQKHDNRSDSLLIMAHGLEGSANRPYVRGMVKLFHQHGFDAIGWNCRSCSGEMNNTLKLYHHGWTDDLDLVVQHAIKLGYSKIVLAGVSMGGSISLKYTGERGDRIAPQIKATVVFSVPCSLVDSVEEIEKKRNRFYRNRFLRKLKKKLLVKSTDFPDVFDKTAIKNTHDFYTFDSKFTSRIYGYNDALDFYQQVQSINFLDKLNIPTLLINALNDPLLSSTSYPTSIAEKSPFLHLIITRYGGHVGFLQKNKEFTWAEEKAIEFVNRII